MKILFLTAEVAPFSTVGGLSQVMYFLPRALQEMGHDVRIFSPKYGSIDVKKKEKKWVITTLFEGLKVPLADPLHPDVRGRDQEDYLICNVRWYEGKGDDPHVYLLENHEYYELRANVFGYGDDHVRFALLSKGCLEYFYQQRRREGAKTWWPDMIHGNDWHTGYAVELLRRSNRYKKLFAKTGVVFTVHNFAFQGNFDFRYAPPQDKDTGETELASILSPKLQEQNALMRGIKYSDATNTVSPTHAIEALTPEFSYGLNDVLENARGKLGGILNGLDIEEFDPATDLVIKRRFTQKTFERQRRENKKDLQKTFFLPENDTAPVLISVGRLALQKGWDLLFEVLPHLFQGRPDLQCIVLGSSDQADYRERLLEMKEGYPTQLGLHLRGDFRLPRKMYAGADAIVIPSHFEPGGIVAMEAMRYGCVPIVRRTGGLNDIVKDFDPEKGTGNGFSFSQRDPWVFYASIIEMLTVYKQQTLWYHLVSNCLLSDFSWKHAAKEYEELYRKVVLGRKRAVSETPHPAYEVTA
ncbi:MAG: glycogen/starch synthase [bacterium]|nr:glycogen/starch synthase [bacterium]